MTVSWYNKETWILLRGAKLSVNRCSRKVTDGGWWERLYEASEIARCFSIERRIQKNITLGFAICKRLLKNNNICFFPHINLLINHHACHYSYKLRMISLVNLSRSRSPICCRFFWFIKNELNIRKGVITFSDVGYILLSIFKSVIIFLCRFKDRLRYIKTCTTASR